MTEHKELLSPSQRTVLEGLKRGLAARPMAYLSGRSGRGMSTVLRALAGELGSKFLSAAQYAPALASGHPLGFEDRVMEAIGQQIVPNGSLVLDDLHLILNVAHYYYTPRNGLIRVALIALCQRAESENCRLILGADCCLPEAIQQRGFGFTIPRFTEADYDFLIRKWAAELAEHLDVGRIFRFAPKLDAHHLHAVTEWWKQHTSHSTDDFISVLRAQRLGSNVDLAEVQAVSLDDLVGVDDAVQTLLRTIVMPHEDEELARQLGLRAKRGVLLYGPPGTGKTTVGRALAHRLRGKFFLIDGTFIAGTEHFYSRVHQVFEAAKESSPSVIFIDDADAIFENRSERGLYRYLLTMIDGLESESNSQVTVMLTAMDLGDLPAALVRSGRVELWLEMRLPDPAARRKLMERLFASFPEELRGDVTNRMVEATEGLTGADLKVCVSDVKLLYAVDKKSGIRFRDLETYLLDAAAEIRASREKREQALAASRQRNEQPVPSDNMPGAIPSMEDDD